MRVKKNFENIFLLFIENLDLILIGFFYQVKIFWVCDLFVILEQIRLENQDVYLNILYVGILYVIVG